MAVCLDADAPRNVVAEVPTDALDGADESCFDFELFAAPPSSAFNVDMRQRKIGERYGETSRGQLRIITAITLALSSLCRDSLLYSSSAKSCSMCARSAGRTYAGFLVAKRPSSSIPNMRMATLSSFTVKNNALRDFACDRYESIDALGRQNSVNSAFLIDASLSPTATGMSASMMFSTAVVTLLLDPTLRRKALQHVSAASSRDSADESSR